MNTHKRMEALSHVFLDSKRYGFSCCKDLEIFLDYELGSAMALEEWIPAPQGKCRAIAPKKIYIICAGNLSVSAEITLLLGLLLGSELFFKLPSCGLPEFEVLVSKLPENFQKLVHILPIHDEKLMQSCEAVIIFGSDETIAEVRRSVLWKQKFLAYGHKISIGLLNAAVTQLEATLPLAAQEITAYDQLGCLSPQAYLCTTDQFARDFAEGLAVYFKKNKFKPPEKMKWEDAALIYSARQEAHARGDRLWESEDSPDWTVALRHDKKFDVGPGHCFIQVAVLDEDYLLSKWKGLISSISMEPHSSSTEWKTLAQKLGASRLCEIGRLQQPLIAWRHDGRPRVADLVSWISQEGS